jgi:putative chitinase
MNLSITQLERAAGIPTQRAELWVNHINRALVDAGAETPEQVAQFIAQVGHESGSFVRLVESLDYKPDALKRTWPSRYTDWLAAQHGRSLANPADQRAIANHVYGGRLGNTGPDDGWHYRGRGLIQVTGRENYRKCGEALNLDLVARPELLELRDVAASSAAWFWRSRGLAALGADVEAVTRVINGGANGLDDRRKRFSLAISALGGGLRKVGEVAP